MQALLQQSAAARSDSGLSGRRLCRRVGLSRATLCRWQRRQQRGQPLLRSPGPAKIAPLPLAEVRQRLEQLRHGRKRTGGTGELYRHYQESLSRRQLGAWVQEARQQQRAQQRAQLQQVSWFHAQTTWALDATEWPTDQPGVKLQVLLARDLASNYNLGVQADYQLTGSHVAHYVTQLIVRHGPPLFLKRDNGAALHTQEVQEVLAGAGILPLNSPAYYPRYNGGMEKHIGDFKRLFDYDLPSRWEGDLHPARSLLEALRHESNARPRRSLRHYSPAELFHGGPRLRVHRADRLAIFNCLWERTCRTLSAMMIINHRTVAAVWRQTAEFWLRCQNLIAVTHPNQTNTNPQDQTPTVTSFF